MREIVFDTETTGFEPEDGDRLVEIGCVEVVNQIPTGKHYHQYINPERDMPEEAFAVHGLSERFLRDYPVFSEVVGGFLDFVGESPLVAHNASFDMKFINFELKKCGFDPIPMTSVIDSLAIARDKFPGSPASLDALCKRYDIDNTERTLHGALLDAELLAEVYLELLGGRQHMLGLAGDSVTGNRGASKQAKERVFREPRVFELSVEERASHDQLLEELTEPLWKQMF